MEINVLETTQEETNYLIRLAKPRSMLSTFKTL